MKDRRHRDFMINTVLSSYVVQIIYYKTGKLSTALILAFSIFYDISFFFSIIYHHHQQHHYHHQWVFLITATIFLFTYYDFPRSLPRTIE